ncbi:hypothetical protein HOLleu_18791 [Holothuria leucospilota]|uniref:Uncharacterized protein n=1 Tax=Holothuria leucospilota TaxID=206669 RepID=A0A9Q1C4D5_HOLLE|nr:hypothetical protein HOLleu_18791 [Holothuria leucospilota]
MYQFYVLCIQHGPHIQNYVTNMVTTIQTNLGLPRWPLGYCHLHKLTMNLQHFRQNTNMNGRTRSQSFILYVQFDLNLHSFKNVTSCSQNLSILNHLSKFQNFTHKSIAGSHIGKPKRACMVATIYTYDIGAVCSVHVYKKSVLYSFSYLSGK